MPRIFVWYAEADDVRDPRLIARCEALLLDDERRQYGRFVQNRHRHEYLLTRALARGVLGDHLGVEPSALAFVRNEFGRPELHPPSEWRFNLTNSPRLIACGVARGIEIGIDTEPLDRAEQILGIASSVFTASERATLNDRRAV